MNASQELIEKATELVDKVDGGWSAEWLENAQTFALVAIAIELKRMNDRVENDIIREERIAKLEERIQQLNEWIGKNEAAQ